jgi:hypothetical protein
MPRGITSDQWKKRLKSIPPRRQGERQPLQEVADWTGEASRAGQHDARQLRANDDRGESHKDSPATTQRRDRRMTFSAKHFLQELQELQLDEGFGGGYANADDLVSFAKYDMRQFVPW